MLDIVVNIMKDRGGINQLNHARDLPHVVVKRLPVVCSKISTFPLVNCEQMSIVGNKESLARFTRQVMGLRFYNLSEELRICSGDQLTMDRWRSIMILTDTEPLSECFDWNLPIPGLFHTKQTYMKMFTSNHGGETVEDVSSITGAQWKLRREKIDKGCSDLCAMKSLMGHILMAQVLGVLAAEWKVNTLDELAEKCQNGNQVVECINKVAEEYLVYNAVANLREKSVRDIVFENGLLSLRHNLWVHSFHQGVAEGDIGKVKDLLDIWPPCFLRSKHYKYTIEMLEIQCGFKAEWSMELQEVVLRNWLVNPPGLANHFLPVDEFQEKCVRMLKEIHNSGGAERTGEFLRETVARLLCVFRNITKSVRVAMGGTDYRSGHTRSDGKADVKALFDMYMDKALYTKIRNRGVAISVGDESRTSIGLKACGDWYQDGMDVLTEGVYWEGFVKRGIRGMRLQYCKSYDDVEENEERDGENEDGGDVFTGEDIFLGAMNYEE